MTSNLRMPLSVLFASCWSKQEVYATTSYVKQVFQDLFGVTIQEDVERLPPGEGEAINLRDPLEYHQLGGGEFRAARCYFADSLLYYGFTAATVKGEPEDAGGATRGNIAVLDGSVLLKRFGKGNAYQYAFTMGHELGHVLGLHHHDPPFTGPNLMCSEATHGKRPCWHVTPEQVERVRKYGQKSELLL